MSFSQLRAKMRGGLDIVWVIEWIESIPKLGLGKFDFVGCTGVLHHLKNPQKGLNEVNEIQTENGGAEYMVYGTIGRTGIYQIQNLLKIINEHGNSMERELKEAKGVLKVLPDDHWFRHFHFSDVNTMGDIGIYDLLLHKRDVSYTVRDLYEWVQHGGYKFVDHSLPENRLSLSIHIRINDNVLFKKLNKMRISLQEAVSEIMVGNVIKQDVYVSKIHNSEAILKPGESVVYAHGSPTGFRHVMNDHNNHVHFRTGSHVVATLARSRVDENSKNFKHYSLTKPTITGGFIWPSNDFNNFIISELTKKPNRPKDLAGLINGYNHDQKLNITIQEGSALFNDLFSYLKMTGVFYLKHKVVPKFPLTCCSNQFSILGHDTSTILVQRNTVSNI